MAFSILNIINGIALFLLFIYVDSRMKESHSKQYISMIAMATVVSFLYALTIILGLFVNDTLTHFFGIITMFFVSLFSIRFALFCFLYPNRKLKFYHIFVGVVLVLFSAYILLTQFETVGLANDVGLYIESNEIGIDDFTWLYIFKLIFIWILPAFSLLTLFMRADALKNKIHTQQIFAITLSYLSVILLYKLTDVATEYISPMFNTIIPYIFTVFIIQIYGALKISLLYDFKSLFSIALRNFYTYVIPAIVMGIVLMYIFPLRKENFSMFIVLFALSVFVVMFVSYYVIRFLTNKIKFHQSDYAIEFEKDLAKLDYDGTPVQISEKLAKILQSHLDISSVEVLIEFDENELTTVYSTINRNTKIHSDPNLFDVILNNNHPVIFKNHLNTHHALAPIKKELAKVLDDNFAEAMIVLKEGRKVFGVILLGPKKLGNAFTDYDYTVFQNFYSYFFVCGYYLKNIVKESVVGTVNRELKFSGQIIRSIQENIDQIENPKIDIGYISKSARNLGGEFVDFIRLSDERYIMVFGDLSGKGINASMSMVIIKSIVRTFLAETRDFKVLVQKVNEFIRFNLPKGTFFAGMFALMDFTDNTVYYINCGIPAFFMYNQQYNNVIEIQGEGRVLGFVKSIEKLIRVKKIKLNPGDMLLACSDGLIDSVSMRGEPFGKARVQTTILENLNYPAEKMTNFLYNDLLDFTSKEQEDDVTIVAIKCRSK